jgi:hypothetical protein
VDRGKLGVSSIMRPIASLSLGVIVCTANCGGRTGLESLTVSGGSPSSTGRQSSGGRPNAGGAGGSSGACTWGFAPQVAHSVGSVPGAVASGDFDDDGFLDLAVAAANDVRILINRKDGSFLPPVAYNGGDTPVSVTPGDFNADRFLDLVTVTNVNGTSAVSLLFNRGDGSFQSPITFPAGRTPNDAIVGDLDRDGSLDLAVNDSNSFSIFLNRGDGTFLPQVIYELPASSGIALADFDRNGSLDIAAASVLNGTVAILFNQGTGTFTPPTTYSAGEGSSSMAPADFNGDGAPDLAIAHNDLSIANHGGNTVAVLLNRGDGTFGASVSYTVGSYAGSLRSGDFNADGSPDLVVNNQHDNTLSVLINQKDGTFQPQASYATGRLPETIAVGDYNRDGWLDVAVNNWQDNSIGLFFGQCR